MADIFETRSYAANLRDACGVTRLACIGDSMMYGFGGPERDALPSQLARVLNGAYPDKLVFVDNFGGTSGNLWNAWTAFKPLAGSARFEAVLFSVCQNDLEMFESNQVRYGSDRLQTFLEPSPTWAAAADLLDDVEKMRAATGIDAMVMFYTFHPGDRPMIDRIAAKCATLGLPFFDALDFLQTETAITAETYVVSEFDGHPSAAVHELVARRLAREFLARGFLRSGPALPGDIGRLQSELVRSVRSMMDQSVPADLALQWAMEACEIKGRTVRRRIEQADAGARATAWQTAAAGFREALIRWRNSLRRHPRAAALQADRLLATEYLPNLYMHRINFAELLYVLRQAGPKTDLAAVLGLFAPTAHFSDGKFPEFDGDIGAAARDARARIDATIASLQIGAPAAGGELPTSGMLPLDPEAGLEAFLAHEVRQLERQIAVLEEYARGFPNGIAASAPGFALAGVLLTSLRSAFIYVERLTACLDEAVPLDRPHGLPWTIVAITIEGAPDAAGGDTTFDLVVQLHYADPRRGIIRERQLGSVIKPRATYRFEFPLMLAGDIDIGLPDRGVNRELFSSGRARIARIEIGNADWEMRMAEAGARFVWDDDAQPRHRLLLRDVRLS